MSNYREIFICNSYYSNGSPTYASIHMPVSLFTNFGNYVFSAGVNTTGETYALVGISAKYVSGTSIIAATTRDDSNNYIVVYGIK